MVSSPGGNAPPTPMGYSDLFREVQKTATCVLNARSANFRSMISDLVSQNEDLTRRVEEIETKAPEVNHGVVVEDSSEVFEDIVER
jgi:hypothetical protein